MTGPQALPDPAVDLTPGSPTARMYGELRLAYDFFNETLFDHQLPGCMLTLRNNNCAGYFSPNRFSNREGVLVDEIGMNPEWWAITPLVETLQTLVHEMVHQWQQHHGSPSRGSYHNAQFASKMESLGLETFTPSGNRLGESISDRPIAGGRFLSSVQRLFAEKTFALTWFDRQAPLPPEALEPLRAAREAAGTPAAALMVPANSGVEVRSRHQAPGPSNVPLPSDAGAEEPTRRQPSNDKGSAASDGELRSGERVKYQCPGASDACQAKPSTVWGRSDLRLMCMNCNGVLTPVRGNARVRRGYWQMQVRAGDETEAIVPGPR